MRRSDFFRPRIAPPKLGKDQIHQSPRAELIEEVRTNVDRLVSRSEDPPATETVPKMRARFDQGVEGQFASLRNPDGSYRHGISLKD